MQVFLSTMCHMRDLSINQNACQCQELRDLLKGRKSTVLLEMSLCFMACCGALKHLLEGRELSSLPPLFFIFLFSLPQRSNSLKVLFTKPCLLRKEDESENQSCAKNFKVYLLVQQSIFSIFKRG